MGVNLQILGKGVPRYIYYTVALISVFVFGCQPDPDQTLPTLQPTAVSLQTAVSLATITPSPTVSPTAVPIQDNALPPTLSGTATPTSVETVELTSTPEPIIPFQTQSVNQNLFEVAEAEGAQMIHVLPTNSGYWRFPTGFVEHPIGLVMNETDLFLLDRGRVIQMSISNPQIQSILLSEGAVIEDVPIIELVDLSLEGNQLLVLDRAGDVFRYDIERQLWSLDWYGRFREESSGHYYTAVTSLANDTLLLESSYQFIQRYGDNPRIWSARDALGVDIVEAEATYVLQQDIHSDEGILVRYIDATTDPQFVPIVSLERVRQLMVTETAVYVLDLDGSRVVQLDKDGQLLAIYQTPLGTTSFFVDQNQLIFTGAYGIVWFDQPQIQAQIESSLTDSIASIEPFLNIANPIYTLPIQSTGLTERPLQMPGAPRHYRLGVHEGIDFYWRTGTPIYAVAAGTIIRADLNYKRPSLAQFEAREDEIADLGKTSESALNFYRGRQVWIKHENGFVTRYAHLSEIADDVMIGQTVEQGSLIGFVGNSGSPASIDSQNADAHLHLEIWHDESYLGQYLRPIEAWELVKLIFR